MRNYALLPLLASVVGLSSAAGAQPARQLSTFQPVTTNHAANLIRGTVAAMPLAIVPVANVTALEKGVSPIEVSSANEAGDVVTWTTSVYSSPAGVAKSMIAASAGAAPVTLSSQSVAITIIRRGAEPTDPVHPL